MEAIKECVAIIVSRPGWTMQRLADDLGIHYESLRRLKAGRFKEPPFHLVAEIFRRVPRSLDELAGITSSPQPELTEDEQRLLVELRQRAERAEWMLDQLRGEGAGEVEAGDEEEIIDELGLQSEPAFKQGVNTARARRKLRHAARDAARRLAERQDSQDEESERTG